MEENKLLRRKKKAIADSSKKTLAEICQQLGDYYNGKTKYDHALKEYKQSATIYKQLGLTLETGRSHRMVGEMYMLLAEFELALKHQETYLSIVRDMNNKVEEQRALATLGRTFLLQGQSVGDESDAKSSLKAAEKAFMKSLVICESLKGRVNNHEFMDMRARLLLNIGVVLEHLGIFERSVEFIQKAITICKNEDLHELLNQCYITEGLLYFTKHQNNSKALQCFNSALEVASRLENKVLKQCEVLNLKADTLCKMTDFHSAKVILMKAWKKKSPDENERNEIERKLKIVAALCYSEDLLVTSDSNEHETMMKLHEKVGDGACSLKNYDKAIGSYHKMLEYAEKAGYTGKKLAPIYVCLYQTYKDIGNYEKALEYYEKEYEIIKDIPSEAFTTLINIADAMISAGKSHEDVETTYQKAREEAMKEHNEKRVAKSFKLLTKLYKDIGKLDKVKQLEDDISLMGNIKDFLLAEESSDEEDRDPISQNTPDIGDEICLEDLTDLSQDDENEENDKPRVTRKRGKGFAVKKNTKGETQLHQACISGNLLLVNRLISQGHPVNVRDNAGWLPLHESCIHGHKDIVEILIKHGAHINDRGGTQCDGISPICDAASNGHLDIVALLLENGASPSIKNDAGHTTLDVLKRWRKRTDVDPTDHIFYETLCSKMQKNILNISTSESAKVLKVQSEEKNSRRPLGDQSLSLNKQNLRKNMECMDDILGEPKNSINMNMRKQRLFPDTSNSESEDSMPASSMSSVSSKNHRDDSSQHLFSSLKENLSKQKSKHAGVSEYKNAMKALRTRQIDDVDSDDGNFKENEKRKKGAILASDEVGEDWLEDDLVKSHSKKRKTDEVDFVSIINSGIDASIGLVQGDIDYEHKSDSENSNPNEGVFKNIDVFLNSSASPLKNVENLRGPQSRKSSGNVLVDKTASRKWKRQASLLKSGFSRKRNVHSTSNDNYFSNDSDTESCSNVSMSSITGRSRYLQDSEEPDSTSEQLFTPKTLSPEALRISNLYSITQSQPSLPPASIKVKVQDKLLLIPIKMDKVDSLSIDWLAKEASRRYYNVEGVQPTLSLLTSDGAILADDDPVSLIIGQTELRASITSWNLPPLGDRYIECCTQFEIEVDNHLRNMLESSQATHSLSLPNLNLCAAEIKPIFKAINHQTNLTTLILPNNCLGSEGIKHLSLCLPSLNQIKCINLSGNCIDAEGIGNFVNLFEKSVAHSSNILELDLSFNPLGDVGFCHLLRLTKHVRLKSLNIKSCDIVKQSLEHSFQLMNLNDLETLNLSFNDIHDNVLKIIFISLNTNVLTNLILDGLKINCQSITEFLDSDSNTSLVKISLSRCNLTDSDVTDVLRSITKCEALKEIQLCYNAGLTFLSLKKLLQHSPSFSKIDLEGSQEIFKYFQESDFQKNLFSEKDLSQIECLKLTVDKTYKHYENIIKLLTKHWVQRWDSKSNIKTGLYGEISFTTT